MKIGVCGTGTIASWISDTICQLENENIALYTCATSPGFVCDEFAAKYGYTKISGSFEELLQDPEVDLVYIALPNHMHYEICRRAIECGKHVVCEKPFSADERECGELLRAAHEKGVFISEALWPVFLPAYRMIKEEIAAGTIGRLHSGTIRMMDNVMFLDRVKHLETGGGVLMDEGPYTLGCMTAFFGTDIKSLRSKTRKLDTGVDAEDEIWVEYQDGCRVHIHQSMDAAEAEQERYVELEGTKGKIRMDAVANPDSVEIFDLEGQSVKRLEIPKQIRFRGMPPVSGYEYEWIAFEKAIEAGRKECAEIPGSVTLAIAHMMSQVLENAGIVFPFIGEKGIG